MKNKKYNNWKIVVHRYEDIIYKVELFNIEKSYTYEYKSSELNLTRNSPSWKALKLNIKNYSITRHFEFSVSTEKIARRLYKKYCYFIKIQDSLINSVFPYLGEKNSLITTIYYPKKK